MASTIRSINTWLHRILVVVGSIALVLMTIIVCSTVFMRYVLNMGNAIAEEVPRLLVTLLAFIAMAMGVRDHAHISADLIYARFPRDGVARKVMDIFSDVIVLLCGLFMLYYGWQRVALMMTMSGELPMTRWPTWIQYLPIPLGGFMITFDSILFLTGVLKRDDHLFEDSGEEGIVEEAMEQVKQQKKEAAKK